MEHGEVALSVLGLCRLDGEVDVFVAGVHGPLYDVVVDEDLVTLAVDEVSLLVQDIVVLEKVLSYVEYANSF